MIFREKEGARKGERKREKISGETDKSMPPCGGRYKQQERDERESSRILEREREGDRRQVRGSSSIDGLPFGIRRSSPRCKPASRAPAGPVSSLRLAREHLDAAEEGRGARGGSPRVSDWGRWGRASERGSGWAHRGMSDGR